MLTATVPWAGQPEEGMFLAINSAVGLRSLAVFNSLGVVCSVPQRRVVSTCPGAGFNPSKMGGRQLANLFAGSRGVPMPPEGGHRARGVNTGGRGYLHETTIKFNETCSYRRIKKSIKCYEFVNMH